MVISRLRSQLRRQLGENAHEADWIITHVTGLSPSDFVLSSRDITKTELREIGDIVKRRNSGEPLQYILGETEFMGLTFRVNEQTLIPRADTETLAETVIEHIGSRPLRVLDIGTGSGCIGISIAKLCKRSTVTLLDRSDAILAAAAENASLNGVSAETVKCDILKATPEGVYDVIVSNPPYIETAVISGLDSTVRDYEPIAALDGGEDGLVFYRRIIGIAPDILESNGFIAFEIGFDQGGSVTAMLRDSGFTDVSLKQDPCGNDRVVTARLKRTAV